MKSDHSAIEMHDKNLVHSSDQVHEFEALGVTIPLKINSLIKN